MSIPSSKRLYILDSLRGLAALIVCFHHLFSLNFAFFEKELDYGTFRSLIWISELNHLAVLFFFVLSGFSIGLALKAKSLDTKEELNDYFYRRLKRILPIYLLSIFITFICGLIMHELSMPDYSLKTFLGNLFFLQTSKFATNYWIQPYGQNGPLWSLAYEMFFYLIFPIVFKINRVLPRILPVFLKALFLLSITLLSVYINKLHFVPYLAFFNLFIIWILGFIAARSYHYGTTYHMTFLGLTIVSLIYLLQVKFKSDTLTSIFEGVIVASAIYIIVQTQHTFPERIKQSVELFLNKCFLSVGKGSFALYAFHYPILLVLTFFKTEIITQIFVLIFLIPASKYTEEYFIRKKMLFLKFNYLPFK